MRFLSILILFCIFTFSCTSLNVVNRNPTTGYFKTPIFARIIQSEEINLDSLRGLVVVPKSPFSEGMAKNINYFEQVMTTEELEQQIIALNLQNDIPTVDNLIGLSKAAQKYKPFLFLSVSGSKRDGKQFAQLKMMQAKSGKFLFTSEIEVDMVWNGVSDQTVWYPLYNSLIDYLRAHSTSYK